MNERIRKLAEQARLGRGPEKIHISENGVVIFYLDELEKFAELIVRECAGICDQQGRVGWNDDRKAQAKLDRDLINEHFGVEE